MKRNANTSEPVVTRSTVEERLESLRRRLEIDDPNDAELLIRAKYLGKLIEVCEDLKKGFDPTDYEAGYEVGRMKYGDFVKWAEDVDWGVELRELDGLAGDIPQE